MGKTKRLLTKACRERNRGNSFKLKEDMFRLERRKTFFKVRAVRHRIRLPGEVLDVLSLEVFKVRLDGALRNLV